MCITLLFIFVFYIAFISSYIPSVFILQAAMSSGSEERHQLRQDLAEAQQRLDQLKEMQRQMTISGVVPPSRVSPRLSGQ